MAKKTTKTARRNGRRPAAPLRAERTASRAAAADPEPKTVTLDKLGKVQTWALPSEPYAKMLGARAAYVGGFLTRTQQWLNGLSGPPERFQSGTVLQIAFTDGYYEAARQDGADLKPRALVAKKSGKRAT